MARLPDSKSTTSQPRAPTESSRRAPTLGVGATLPQKQLSADDHKLRAKLGGKKRERDMPVVREEPEDEEEVRGQSKKKPKRPDVFAAAEAKIRGSRAKAQSAAPPQGPAAEGVDVSGMSKSQRKKWSKRQRQATGGSGDANVASSDAALAVADQASKSVPAAVEAPLSKAQIQTETAAPASRSPAPLTTLQSSMLASLHGARFRAINERLYTHDSRDARAFMLDEPQLFDEYHEGFRQQVRKWPINPVDRIVELLLGTVRKKGASHTVRAAQIPGALVVDVGAGEASLAKKLSAHARHVLSYDLVDTPDGWVRGVDAAMVGALPLPGVNAALGLAWDGHDTTGPAMADIVVFCLSLMGTNWVDMLAEAWRILRLQGELLIAEVSSRLGSDGATRSFTELVRALGFDLDWEDTSNTHFVLFKFSKRIEPRNSMTQAPQLDTAQPPLSLARAVANASQASEAYAALVAAGATVLKPCLYKRR